MTVVNEGCRVGKDSFELNPDHTHFILVEADECGDKFKNQYVDFRSNFEKQLQCQVGRRRRYRRLLSVGKYLLNFYLCH